MAQIVAIVVGTAAAALVRFVLLKAWLFRSHTSTTRAGRGRK